jgi:hypothetical protein
MGSPQERDDEDQARDGEADAQAVAEGAAGIGGGAAQPGSEPMPWNSAFTCRPP